MTPESAVILSAAMLIDKEKLRELCSNRCLLCKGNHKFQKCDAESTQLWKMTIEKSTVEDLDEVLKVAGKVQLRYAHYITGNLPYPKPFLVTNCHMNMNQLRERVSLSVRAKYVLHIVTALVSAVRQGKMTHAVCCFMIRFLQGAKGLKIASLQDIVNRWIYRSLEQEGELKL